MTQDTSVLSDNDALIAETLRRTPVDVPTEIQKNPVIQEEDEAKATPQMVLGRVSSAGYIYLWDTETKERVPILYYMLPQQMRKKRVDGQFRFSATKPAGEPWRGAVKCLLHQDNPERQYFNQIGFRTCRKENIASPHALVQHMRLKHPQEWKTIEEERAKKEKEVDRALQRAVLESVANKASSESTAGYIDQTYIKRVENMRKAREAKGAKNAKA